MTGVQTCALPIWLLSDGAIGFISGFLGAKVGGQLGQWLLPRAAKYLTKLLGPKRLAEIAASTGLKSILSPESISAFLGGVGYGTFETAVRFSLEVLHSDRKMTATEFCNLLLKRIFQGAGLQLFITFVTHRSMLGDAIPVPENTVPVPHHRQEVNYSCGTSCALSLLRHWKGGKYHATREQELYRPMGTTSEDGTEPQAIEAFLNSVPGMKAEFRHGDKVTIADLEAAIDAKQPPIVDIQAWQVVESKKQMKPWESEWNEGHYVVLIGKDDKNYYFMDPSTDDHYGYIPKAEFLQRWHDTFITGERAKHMTIFVSGSDRSAPPAKPAPTLATRIDYPVEE